MQPLYSLICCNHLVEILCKKLLFARMWPSECEICEMHAMCLKLDNFGHCERRLLFNTHDLWNSLSVYFFCLHTHSTLDIHFIAVDDLKTKAYESKEKIMSRTVDLISKNRLIHHAFFILFLYASWNVFTALEVGFILSDFYEPTAQSTSSLRFNCGIKTGIPLFLQERSLYSSCLVHKELAQKLY